MVREKGEKDEYSEYYFGHLFSTKYGSSGGPILNLSNSKLLGIHKGSYKSGNFNIGLYLNEPINDFFKKHSENIEKKN